jgi:hypothetical protein
MKKTVITIWLIWLDYHLSKMILLTSGLEVEEGLKYEQSLVHLALQQ